MSNSPLVDYIHISPNRTSPRNQKIDRITIHHMAGNLTVETCGAGFALSPRQASSNYAIGSDGRVGMYVEEKDRSWCSSSGVNDNRAVTIEVANCQTGEPWPVSDAAYKKLIQLCVDICQRNGIKRLNYTGDTTGNLTMHCWFAATNCPGTYLKERFPAIAEEVNRRLEAAEHTNKEDDMDISKLTNEQCYEIIQKAQAYAATLPLPNWAVKEFNQAGFDGITDGTSPQAFVTRMEAAIMADRALKK